jgi:hypothetical protein
MRRRATPIALAGCLLTLLILSQAAPAAASYDPLASGTTRLSLDKSFLGLLREHGVKLEGREGARVKGRVLSFPVSGGKFDPAAEKGTVEHQGTVLFKAGARKLALGALQLKTTRPHTPLSAKVGGGQLKLASTAGLAVTRAGFGSKAKTSTLALSAKLATRLAKRLHLRGVFAAGRPLGTAVTRTVPATVAIVPTGRLTFAPDPAFLSTLDSHFVSLNPIAPAELAPGPLFSFPIAPEGQLAPDATSGTLRLAGELEFLQLGGGQVFWHEPWLDPAAHGITVEADVEPSPPYPGKQGRIAVLGLGAGVVSSDPGARTIAVAGAPLTLQAAAAAAFNEAFAEGEGAFGAGEAVGTVSFRALGR